MRTLDVWLAAPINQAAHADIQKFTIGFDVNFVHGIVYRVHWLIGTIDDTSQALINVPAGVRVPMKVPGFVWGFAAALFIGSASLLPKYGSVAGVTQTANALAAKKCRKGYTPSKKTGRCIKVRRGSG